MRSEIKGQYEKHGYVHIKSFLSENERSSLKEITERFHQSWLKENEAFYKERAINSAYLTGKRYLNNEDRTLLFKLIGSNKIMNLARQFPIHKIAFLNTQLFFNPYDPELKNYWHRDGQYNLSLEKQREALSGPEALHFRFALEDEPGIELIPGSHRNWDSEEELKVRLEKDDKRNFDSLKNGKRIPLKKSDLLIFSGNMIHRGLYGMNRFAFDLLFCEAAEDFIKYAEHSCMPEEQILRQIEDPEAFSNSLAILNE